MLSRSSAGRSAPRALAAVSSLGLLSASATARAVEVPVAGQSMEIDVTNTAILNHHFDNKNSVPRDAGTHVDDNYNEWLDRFNLQISWWRLRLGARLDTYVASSPSETDIERFVEADADPADPDDERALSASYTRELNNRFRTTIYPAKLFLAYQQPSLEVTLGDFYVQLGRGLVFSVRKIDELSIDTTVRGAKASFDKQFGPVRIGAIAFAGEMNPLRVDETSGRRLEIMGDNPLFFGFPTAREVTTTQLNQVGVEVTTIDAARPSYLEDLAYGGKLEIGFKNVVLGANFAAIARKDYALENAACLDADEDATVDGTTITQGLCYQQYPVFASPLAGIKNFSGVVNVPTIAGHGDAYLEIAGQQIDAGQPTAPAESGYAIYASGSVRVKPFALTLEGKHYRRYIPIAANIETASPTSGFTVLEFTNIAYSQMPTAQSIFIAPVAGAAPNVCATGGRANLSARLSPRASVFGWLGRFMSLSEVDGANNDCAPEEAGLSNRTDTWDWAAGTELSLEGGKSKVNVYMGALDITLEDPHLLSGYLTDTFYREGYVRYDLVKHIAGPFSVQTQGWHRRRYEPGVHPDAWWEGENYAAIQWSPHIAGIFGFEYELREGCASSEGVALDNCVYFNGGAQWKSSGKGGALGKAFDTVNVFVGERRGGLRCVSGVCRVFPPFAGAKLELVSRF